MVVTASTAERQTEKRPAGRFELLVDDVHSHLGFVSFGENLRADTEKAGRDQLLMLLSLAFEGQEIAGQLLDDKLIERLVAIERCHDVIAISPRISVCDVFIQTIRVRVPRDIEPMPSPAFAVLWRCEQSIDDSHKCVGRIVSKKSVYLIRRRRQTDQIEGDAADERSLIRSR